MNMTAYITSLLFGLLGERFDANETAALAQQLEYVKSQTYDIRYVETRARQFIPVSTEVDPGAEHITYRQYNEYGIAKLIANYADDLPLVDVDAREFSSPVRSLGDAYQWSVQDLRRSAMAARSGRGSTMDIDTRRARAARNAMERKVELLAAFGDAATGLPGLLNNPNVPLVTLPNGSWATATPAEILEDLRFLAQSVVTLTNAVEKPNTILMDVASYGLISGTPIGTDLDRTILSVFLDNNPYITDVDMWELLGTADAAQTGPRLVVYNRDPQYLSLEIPQDFEQLPPQARNLAYVVPCHMRFGGVLIHYPLSMAYADNHA